MNIASVLEGGLTGASTLSLIQETLHKIDPKAPRAFLHKSGVIKKLKKQAGKKGGHSNKLYIKLAGELLGSATYFGLSGLGKKKHAVLRGALLGATAGLGAAFLNEDEATADAAAQNGKHLSHEEDIKKKIMTVALYTAGGMLAGMTVKRIKKGTLKKLQKQLKD